MEKQEIQEILNRPFTSSRGSFREHYETAVLSVACSDRDFRAALSEFHRQLEEAGVDRIVEPGGPKNLHRQMVEGEGHAIDRAEFLIKHHGIKYILLFGHHACGAYADKYASLGWTQEQMDQQVKADLLNLKEGLKAKFDGNLEIYLYFLQPEGDRVVFQPL